MGKKTQRQVDFHESQITDKNKVGRGVYSMISSDRLSLVFPVATLVYDEDEDVWYIGDGITFGGINFYAMGAVHRKTTRITSTDSPYTVLAKDHIIFADTDGGVITINLPEGTEGRELKIKMCGSSRNNLTLTPNGSELLLGVNDSTVFYDGEVIELHYNSTEGWR